MAGPTGGPLPAAGPHAGLRADKATQCEKHRLLDAVSRPPAPLDESCQCCFRRGRRRDRRLPSARRCSAATSTAWPLPPFRLWKSCATTRASWSGSSQRMPSSGSHRAERCRSVADSGDSSSCVPASTAESYCLWTSRLGRSKRSFRCSADVIHEWTSAREQEVQKCGTQRVRRPIQK